MSDTQQKVELIVACGYGDVGFQMTPNAVTRDWLLSMGYGKLVDAKPALLSAKAADKVAGGAANVAKAVKGALHLR
jgi:hypothetical protein